MGKYLSIALALALCACSDNGGGSGGGGGTFTGTVDGTSIAVADGISATETGSGGESEAIIALSSAGDLCSRLSSDTEDKNEKLVYISIADIDLTSGTVTAPTATGTYTIYDPNGQGEPTAQAAIVDVVITGSDCGETDEQTAQTGTVMLTGISGGVYSGSFDVTLESGDHVTGNFNPGSCPALGQSEDDTGSGSATTPACE